MKTKTLRSMVLAVMLVAVLGANTLPLPQWSSNFPEHKYKVSATFLIADGPEEIPPAAAVLVGDGPEEIPPSVVLIADGPEEIPPAVVLIADGPEEIPPVLSWIV